MFPSSVHSNVDDYVPQIVLPQGTTQLINNPLVSHLTISFTTFSLFGEGR